MQGKILSDEYCLYSAEVVILIFSNGANIDNFIIYLNMGKLKGKARQ